MILKLFYPQECSLEFSYSVASERDTGVDGEWDEDDTEMDPQRTLLLIPASKMPTIMTKLKELLHPQQYYLNIINDLFCAFLLLMFVL